MAIDRAAAIPLRPGWKFAGPHPSAYGLAIDAERAGDPLHRPALAVQRHHLVKPGLPNAMAIRRWQFGRWCRERCGRWGRRGGCADFQGGSRCRFARHAQVMMMAIEHPGQSIPEIAEKVLAAIMHQGWRV